MMKNGENILEETSSISTTVGNLPKTNPYFLSEEYFMPETADPDKAWEYAAIACRTTQNFNRTHPLRIDNRDVEARVQRILNRKERSNNAKQTKKSI